MSRTTYSATVSHGTAHQSVHADTWGDLTGVVNRTFEKAWDGAGKPGHPPEGDFLDVHTGMHAVREPEPGAERRLEHGKVRVIYRRT